jgi:hypothetical protein
MVCLRDVEVFNLITPIGEMLIKVCPQGLHYLNQCVDITDENFNPLKE